ncbi:MAG: helix-turn-helix transcriptional regulator [Bacteroidales bacterium]|jgi:DNA-binding CsgD family transcriptional regulator
MDLNLIKKTFDDILSKQDFGDESPDYSGFQTHIDMLERMADVENSSIAIVDLYKKKFVSIKPKFSNLIAFDLNQAFANGPAYYISFMHPDDIPMVLDTYRRLWDFSLALPIAERKDYKTIFNFRLRSPEGKYYHFIQQLVTLELDKNGNHWLSLTLSDMLPSKTRFNKVTRRIVNMKTGKYFLFDNDVERKPKSVLSNREAEILGLVSRGYVSKEIADQLFISVNTVNNHRQKILEKIKVVNTTEAVAYAKNLGLI